MKMASMTRIECVLSPAHNGSSFARGDLQPGARGVRRRLWYGKGNLGIEALRSDPTVFSTSDVDEVEKAFVESESNILYARGDNVGPHGQYTGFFRAPVSGNYSFLIASDDGARMWYADCARKQPLINIHACVLHTKFLLHTRVGAEPNSVAHTEPLISFDGHYGARQWDEHAAAKGRHSNPKWRRTLAKVQRATRKIALQQVLSVAF